MPNKSAAARKPRYLLDTNAASDIRRGIDGDTRHAKIAARYLAESPKRIFVCPIVIGELRAGAEGSTRKDETNRATDALVKVHPWAACDLEVSAHYGAIHYATKPFKIDAGDLWIAAHARRHGLILVTHNTRHFVRVPGLQIEDWT